MRELERLHDENRALKERLAATELALCGFLAAAKVSLVLLREIGLGFERDPSAFDFIDVKTVNLAVAQWGSSLSDVAAGLCELTAPPTSGYYQ